MPWRFVKARTSTWPYDNADFEAPVARRELSNFLTQASIAEEAGFDWVGFGEEHCNPFGLIPNACIAASLVAAKTSRIRLGVFGAALPLLNPVKVAEEYAWVDTFSGGRLEAGFMRGVPQNYFVYNGDVDGSWDRLEEAAQLIVRLWTADEPVSWRSKYYTFNRISLWPRCAQHPHPPILMTAGSERSARVAARLRARVGEIHLKQRDGLSRVRETFDRYADIADQFSWQPGPDDFVVGVYACIARSDEEAFQKMEPALNYTYNVISGGFKSQEPKPTPLAEPAKMPEESLTLKQRIEAGLVVCGSARTAAEQIAHIHERTGAGIISLHFQVGNMSHTDVCRSIKLCGDIVIPSLNRRRPDALMARKDERTA